MGAPDAVVVGSGPNGLAAAITLARAGLVVEVHEGAATPGGGCRTEELTLPGFRHDVCSAVHPLALASPFFRSLDLERRGVRMLKPVVAFAHPLDAARAASVVGSVEETAATMGAGALAYERVFGPMVREVEKFLPTVLGPMRSIPRHPVAMARFALPGFLPVTWLASQFRGEEVRALFAGAAAHSVLPLSRLLTSSFGLLFVTLGHAYGWPVVEGGSARLVGALVAELESLGGKVLTGHPVGSVDDLPKASAVLLDVGPRQLVALAGAHLPPGYVRSLRRFRYGPGVCKVDWALSGPVPWESEVCRQAGTVHVGGTMGEVAASEAEVAAGRHPQRPFCIVVQPAVIDPSRAPGEAQTLWAYCHVPSGSCFDMTERIEAQIERFAPGFRDLVMARATKTAHQVAEANPNFVGGDITGGMATLRQTFFRPTARWDNYTTPAPGLYLCSSSTPPGGGVHGMCGYWAAQHVLAGLGARRRGDPLPLRGGASFPAAVRAITPERHRPSSATPPSSSPASRSWAC
jgi:phytoene dehydrogenase-like protein